MFRPYQLLGVLTFLYLLHLTCKFAQVPVPGFFSQYFADLLCMPLLLSYTVLGMRWFKSEPSLYLSKGMIFVGVLYVGLVFEVFLPVYFQRYTADLKDVFMYSLGGIFFWIFQKKLATNRNSRRT